LSCFMGIMFKGIIPIFIGQMLAQSVRKLNPAIVMSVVRMEYASRVLFLELSV
jgi:hypothetical protein